MFAGAILAAHERGPCWSPAAEVSGSWLIYAGGRNDQGCRPDCLAIVYQKRDTVGASRRNTRRHGGRGDSGLAASYN